MVSNRSRPLASRGVSSTVDFIDHLLEVSNRSRPLASRGKASELVIKSGDVFPIDRVP